MSGIRRVSDLGTQGVKTILDGSIQTADIANNAITQAKLDTAVPLSGMRNAVINGNFDIWQRGTPISTDAAATQIYTADRWAARALYPGNSSIQTITRESSTSHVPTGSRYSLKSVIGTSAVANNGRMQLSYALESADSLKFAGKQMTLSFKVKGIQNIDRIQIETRYNTSEGRIFDSTLIGSTTFTVNTSSFTSCSYTFTVPSASTMTSTGNFGFVVVYTRASGTEQLGDGIYISQVQLEEGSQPTPFEQRPLGAELALCQRYYWRSTAGLTTDGQNRHAHFRRMNQYTHISSGHCAFPVTMRTEPTVSLYNGNGLGAVDAYGVGQESYVVATGEGLSQNGIGMFVKYTNSSLTTASAFNVDATSVTYWANIEASAEL